MPITEIARLALPRTANADRNGADDEYGLQPSLAQKPDRYNSLERQPARQRDRAGHLVTGTAAGYALTLVLLTTLLTPGAAQAARVAATCSAQFLTLPVRMTVPPSAVIFIRCAVASACRRSAASILF